MAEEKKTYPLTQSAHDRLTDELAHLEGDARQKVIQDIATARAHGDLSENAEYHAAREQQGMQEARIRQIRHMLENAEIIEADDDGVVKPGVLVTIRTDDDQEPETYLLGTREEKGGEHPVLTPESPVGQALVGHTAGDAVEARIPSRSASEPRKMKVEILEVRVPE